MVVADPSALIAGEIAIRDRLMNSGYTVSIVDDNAVVASDAIGAAFVFVSSTVGDAILGAKLRDVPQPVWIAKPYSFDNMLMTGTVANVDYGNVSTDSVTITDATHPLAAGLTGTVLVTPANKTKSWGLPGSAADVVATAGGKPTTFVYQTGDQLVGGTTGARLSPHVAGLPGRTDQFHRRRLGDVRCRRNLRCLELRVSVRMRWASGRGTWARTGVLGLYVVCVGPAGHSLTVSSHPSSRLKTKPACPSRRCK